MTISREARETEIAIVGGGLAGLSAAVYLARALRSVVVIDNGKSMARWEPDVQNYLGFPNGIGGGELVARGREQALRFGAKIVRDEVRWAKRRKDRFTLRGKRGFYTCERLILATGIFHIPPELPALNDCLGHSMFFCKDCDGFRVRGKNVAVYGRTDEAVEYALAMMPYSPHVLILTNGRRPRWGRKSAARIKEYHIPVFTSRITRVEHAGGKIQSLYLGPKHSLDVEALFTTRGDIYFNKIAHGLGATVDKEGAVRVDSRHRTNVPGLYAAGCITPANCQMIIAAGEGAAVAQAVNRDLFERGLETHALRQFRHKQLRNRDVKPRLRKVRSLGEERH